MAISFLGTTGAGYAASGKPMTASATFSAGDNVFVVCTGRPNVLANFTFSDGVNTYSQLCAYRGTFYDLWVYKCDSAASGTVTLSFDTGADTQLNPELTSVALRYSGIAPGAPQASTTGSADAGGVNATDNIVGPSVTATSAGIVLCFARKQGPGNTTPGTGYTLRANAATGSLTIYVQEKASTAGSYAPTFTTTDTFQTFEMLSAAFNEVAGNGNLAWIRA